MDDLIELCPGLQREPFIEMKAGPGHEGPTGQAACYDVTSVGIAAKGRVCGNNINDLVPYFKW